MLSSFLILLFWFAVAHAIGDFALQNTWMVTHKNQHNERDSGSRSKNPSWIWLHVLTAHAFLHAGLIAASVLLVTGNQSIAVAIGMLELIAHWIIDYCKAEHRFGFHTDQILHHICKIVWAILVVLILYQ